MYTILFGRLTPKVLYYQMKGVTTHKNFLLQSLRRERWFQNFLNSTTCFRFLNALGWKSQLRSFNTPWTTSTSLTTMSSCYAISPMLANPSEGTLPSIRLAPLDRILPSDPDLLQTSNSHPSYQWEQWRLKPRQLLTPTGPLWSTPRFDDRFQKQLQIWRVQVKVYSLVVAFHTDTDHSSISILPFFFFKSQLKSAPLNCQSSSLVSSKPFSLDACDLFICLLWCQDIFSTEKNRKLISTKINV